MYWNYVSQDYAPYNDGVIATLVGPSSYKNIQLLAVTSNAFGNTQARLTGNYGSTGWHSVTFIAGIAGTYKLGFACFNTGDQAVDPILLIDNAAGGTSAPGQPIITTTSVVASSCTSVNVNANVTSDGGSQVTARGICWNTTGLPTTTNSIAINGTGTGIFTQPITGLTPGVTYYVRSYATNIVGTAYGSEIVFKTDNQNPTITCQSNISSVIATSASGAVVNYTAPIGTDNCSGATTTRTAGFASGATFPIGTTTVTHLVSMQQT
jgi:hypothetical protein